MTSASLGLIALLLAIVALCVKPVGTYIANVMEGRPIWALRVGGRFERLIYRLCGIDPAQGDGLEAVRDRAARVQHGGRAGGVCACSACRCGCR